MANDRQRQMRQWRPKPSKWLQINHNNWELCLSYATPTTSNGMELRSFLPPPTTATTSSSCSSVHAGVIPCRAAGPSAGKLEERGAHRCCGVDVCVFVRPRPVALEQRISLTGGMQAGCRRDGGGDNTTSHPLGPLQDDEQLVWKAVMNYQGAKGITCRGH